MPAPLKSTHVTDAIIEAVAREIAALRRSADDEQKLREAEHRARMAELEARILSAADIERRLSDRLAELKDGEDGAPGIDGKDGADGVNGVDGKDGTDGADGQGVDDVDLRILDDDTVALSFVRGELTETFEFPIIHGKDGLDGKDGEPGPQGAPGRDGIDGERGPEGPIGKMSAVQDWTDEVHYEGSVRHHNGATYQAVKDTGREPPHDDWQLIASAGRDGADGRSFNVRATWSDEEEYRAMDVVAAEGSAFVARCDNPGACPGPDWQVISIRGKSGKQGDRGAPGPKGDRGEPGPSVTRATIDDEGLFRLVNADGSVVECDFYPVLSKIIR